MLKVPPSKKSIMSSTKKTRSWSHRKNFWLTKTDKSLSSNAKLRLAQAMSNFPSLTNASLNYLTAWISSQMKTASTLIYSIRSKTRKFYSTRNWAIWERLIEPTRLLRTRKQRKSCCLTCKTFRRSLQWMWLRALTTLRTLKLSTDSCRHNMKSALTRKRSTSRGLRISRLLVTSTKSFVHEQLNNPIMLLFIV